MIFYCLPSSRIGVGFCILSPVVSCVKFCHISACQGVRTCKPSAERVGVNHGIFFLFFWFWKLKKLTFCRLVLKNSTKEILKQVFNTHRINFASFFFDQWRQSKRKRKRKRLAHPHFMTQNFCEVKLAEVSWR